MNLLREILCFVILIGSASTAFLFVNACSDLSSTQERSTNVKVSDSFSNVEELLEFNVPAGMAEVKNVVGEDEQLLWNLMQMQVQMSIPQATLLKAYGKEGLLSAVKEFQAWIVSTHPTEAQSMKRMQKEITGPFILISTEGPISLSKFRKLSAESKKAMEYLLQEINKMRDGGFESNLPEGMTYSSLLEQIPDIVRESDRYLTVLSKTGNSTTVNGVTDSARQITEATMACLDGQSLNIWWTYNPDDPSQAKLESALKDWSAEVCRKIK